MERHPFAPIDILKQTDGQTCLPICLLMGYSVLHPEKKLAFKRLERSLHRNSFGLYREYYALAHVVAFTRMFDDVLINMEVDNQQFTQELQTMNKEEHVVINYQPIKVNWIAERVKRKQVILYGDSFFLDGVAHVPHFIYVFEEDNGEFQIINPWDGKVWTINASILEDFVNGFKYAMNWSPLAITMEKEQV